MQRACPILHKTVKITQVVDSKSTREHEDLLFPKSDQTQRSIHTMRKKNIPKLLHGFAYSPVLRRVKRAIHRDLDDGDVGENLAEHKPEGHKDAVIEAWSVETPAISASRFRRRCRARALTCLSQSGR
jgi:hypothetical protein